MASAPSLLTVRTAAARRRIPFDYSFTFQLSGEVEKIHRQTVRISVEASFIAASIGYGFIPDAEPLILGGGIRDYFPPVQPPAGSVILSAPASEPGSARSLLGPILNVAAKRFNDRFEGGIPGADTAKLLTSGFRVNPAVVQRVLNAGIDQAIDGDLLQRLFEVVSPPPDQIQFLYALFDEATGREFQSEPLLNTAGLGDTRGLRPFRQFAAPIIFRPQSVIRMEVTEKTTIRGKLHVALHGFKVLGGTSPAAASASSAAAARAASAAEAARRRRRRRA
jgi:hypothetical protein